jgi:hypothetical protein
MTGAMYIRSVCWVVGAGIRFMAGQIWVFVFYYNDELRIMMRGEDC